MSIGWIMTLEGVQRLLKKRALVLQTERLSNASVIIDETTKVRCFSLNRNKRKAIEGI
jgi:hypothetical protein